MEELHEECGIAGVVDLTGERNVVPLTVKLLEGLEHRGGLATGIAVPYNGAFQVSKDNGPVKQVLSTRNIRSIRSTSAIGHDRYATAGSQDASLAQPEVQRSHNPRLRFGFGWNGNLANADALQEAEWERGTLLKTDGDTELLKMQLLRGLQQHTWNDLAAVFAGVQEQSDGAFNIVMMAPDGSIAAYRDEAGVRPLNYALTRSGIALVASETHAMLLVDPAMQTFPIKPGELFEASARRVRFTQVVPPDPHRCFFEWEYFSDWRSVFDGLSVRDAREISGRVLALNDDISPEGSVVVAVPDSARKAAEAYARTKEWPLEEEGIINLLPGQRTFTTSDPARTEKAKRKYGIRRDRLEGKSIVLVDDSLVRGTTMLELIRRLRQEGGVRQIHLRLACPPILAPCFYGIDFPAIAELLVRRFHDGTLAAGTLPPKVLRELARYLEVDSIQFLPVKDIPLAIGCEIKTLCMACVTGKYPTPCGQKRFDEAEAVARRR